MSTPGFRTLVAADDSVGFGGVRALLREAGLHVVAEVTSAGDLQHALNAGENALVVLVGGEGSAHTLESWVAVLRACHMLPGVLLLKPEIDPLRLPENVLSDCCVLQLPMVAEAMALELAAALCQRFQRSPQHPGVQAAVQSLPHAVVRTDFEGRLRGTNHAFTGLLDYPAGEFSAFSLLSLTAPGQRELEQTRLARRRAGEITRYDSILLAHDGSLRPVTIRGWPGAPEDSLQEDVLLIVPRTPEREMQEALLRDRDLAPRIVSRLGQGISVTDAQRRFEFVNEAFAAMLGKRPEELIGRQASEFSSEEDRAGQQVQNALRRAGHSTSYDIHLKRADGTRLLVNINAVPRWKEGQFAGAIAVVTDLSEQRRTAAALQESEARFRTLIESSQDGIVVHRSGVILYVNPACLVLFRGEHAAQVLGRNILEFVHPDVRAATLERMKAVAQSSTPVPRWEFRGLRLDGSESEMESEGIAIMFDGSPAIYSTVRDITARKRAERAMVESEERYRALVEMSPEPVAVHRKGQLIFVNSAFVKLVGADSPEKAMQWSLLDYVHPDDRPNAVQRMAAIAAGQKEVPLVEMRGVRMDGSDMFVETKGTAIDFEGGPAVFVAVRDLTERRRVEHAKSVLEAELREAQKMQAIGTLAGGIAHDFNNILAIIKGNLQLAIQDSAGNTRALESLHEIDAAASRATNLVRQILSFSRRQPTRRVPLQLAPVVDGTCRMLRSTLPARINLVCRLATDLPPVRADVTQMEQVVINLCTNAMQAMESGKGVIEIDVQPVVLDEPLIASHHALAALHRRHPGPIVMLRVRDNGPGMDATVLARVFEPFFTTKNVDKGTGLGLAVVHGIIEGHEGVIIAESEPGQGAMFSIYLPALEESAAEPVTAPPVELPVQPAATMATARAARNGEARPPSTDSPQAEVVYIDDDEALLLLVERQLGRHGYRIHSYSDPDDALAFLASHQPLALVVTDYNMPGRSGLDVAREVQRLRPGVPVALASGFIDENLRGLAESVGVRELVFKASTSEEYNDALLRILRKLGPG